MISCPSCGSSVSEDKFLRKHFSDIVKCEYKLYHCRSCDLEFWVPLVFIKSIYENEIIEEYSLWHQGEELVLSDNHTTFINYLSHQNLIPPKKILDVGCGSGSFIKYLEKMGFEVWGIDIDSNSINVAKNKLYLKNVYDFSIDEFLDYAIQNNLKFDIITFFEVLEHQPDPVNFLNKISKLLADCGVIAGSVPNRDRLFAEFTRKRNTKSDYDFPPHHFLWFSKKSLKFLLDKVGFEPEIFPVRVEKYMSAERILRYLETIGMKFGKYNFLRSLILLLLRPVSFVIRSVYNISGGLGIMFVGRLKV